MDAFKKFHKSLRSVKNVCDCEEVAVVDVYDDHEVAAGWLTCLEEVLGDVKSVNILNQEVELRGFDIERENAILVFCKSGKKTDRVSLDTVEWPKLTKLQKLWLQS